MSLTSLLRRRGVDAAVVVVAAGGVLEVLLREDPEQAPRTSHWFAAPAVAVVVLALLGRRRLPFGAPAAVWLLAPAVSFVDGRLMTFAFGAYLAGIAAAFLIGRVRDRLQAVIGLLIMLGGSALLVENDPEHGAAQFATVPALFAIAWLAGLAFGARAAQAEAAEERAAQAERERESAARLAVAEERARIARELHDVVAHAVSVMVLAVGAVRHRLPPELADDREALQGVEGAGRDALAEMRRLLGAMHERDGEVDLAPQPGLADLEALVEKVRLAGLPVELRMEGEAVPLPRAVDLSAYRIVQEGLTNALKHSGAGRAEVTVRHGDRAVDLEVRDDGRGDGSGDGLGRGLVGIRERVKIYGGEMTAGPAPGGGFVLSARLPHGGRAS